MLRQQTLTAPLPALSRRTEPIWQHPGNTKGPVSYLAPLIFCLVGAVDRRSEGGGCLLAVLPQDVAMTFRLLKLGYSRAVAAGT